MRRLYVIVAISLVLFSVRSEAAFVSGSTGSLGAFNPASNTEVVLPADGILHYTTVNIPSGVTVTFKKNAANTPVYMLASGDVTIAGKISVEGASTVSTTGTAPGAGGPGGYPGGFGGATGLPGGKGIGPGGGAGGPSTTYAYGGGGGYSVAGGTYATNHGAGGASYGNARIAPMIGGSGGGGCAGSASGACYGGGGGGGAIVIASSTSIAITGTVSADGGDGYNYAGGGSGGAIKLMANTISGTGTITAKGGDITVANKGGQGRIRIEAVTNNLTAGTDPVYTYGQPGSVFVASMPSLRITTVAGASVPANPTGSYAQPDILLASTTVNPVALSLAASNIPPGTTVTVTVMPQYGSATNVTTTLSGSSASSTASANVTLSTSYANVIMAQATFTMQVAMYYEGEKIEKVMVASTLGSASKSVYITESGREIPEELMLAQSIY